MGLSFNNIQLRISGAFDPEALVSRLTADKNLTPVESADEADVRIRVLRQPGSQWITVASDLFDADPETADSMSRDLAQAFGAPVLTVGCFDSDYLYLNLLDPAHNVDAWAATGRFPGGRAPRRSNFTRWQGYAADVERFRQVMRQRHVFAEECLTDVAQLLSIPVEQLSCLPEDDTAGAETGVFFFRADSSAELTEPPEFEARTYNIYYSLDAEPVLASFINKGGASRGVGIAFGGPCFDRRKVRIKQMHFQTHDRQGEWVFTPVELNEITDANGHAWMYGECPSLPIPEAIPDTLPPGIRQKKEFQRMITVRFSAGNHPRQVSGIALDDDMYIVLIPLANKSGQKGVCLKSPVSCLLMHMPYLQDLLLTFTAFAPDENNDHAHCDICWRKISGYPNDIHQAYTAKQGAVAQP